MSANWFQPKSKSVTEDYAKDIWSYLDNEVYPAIGAIPVQTLNEAYEITERWLGEYNSERPYESLNNQTPEECWLMEKTGALKKCVELKLRYFQTGKNI